jgi:hypothetical protein
MGKLTFWIVGGCVGYLIGGGIGTAITVLVCVFLTGLWNLLGILPANQWWDNYP